MAISNKSSILSIPLRLVYQRLASDNFDSVNKLEPHPDIEIRNFNTGCSQLLMENKEFQNLLTEIFQVRPGLPPLHMASLLPRAAQFTLRKQKIKNYGKYTPEYWQKAVLPKLIRNPIFINSLSTRNHSTTRPYTRYRALAALCSGLSNKNLIVYDWGCSLNLGLTEIIHKNYLYQKTFSTNFIDKTPNKLITNLLAKNHVKFATAYGVDDHLFNTPEEINWVAACERFSDYDNQRQQILKDIKLLNKYKEQVKTLKFDISDPNLPKFLISQEPRINNKRRIIHCSMVLYQLSQSAKQRVFQNAKQILKNKDIFIELASKNNTQNWFKKNTIISTVRFKTKKHLTQPYEWLVWNNIGCQIAMPGRHFDIINKKLKLDIDLATNIDRIQVI